jgi:hypothetical protein
MKHLNKNMNDNNVTVTAATLVLLATIIVVFAGVSTSSLTAIGSISEGGGEETGFIDPNSLRKAPTVVSGDQYLHSLVDK